MKNQIIITADDFGISKENNLAIMEAYKNGVLTSTCLMANGEAFDHAIEEVLPQIPEISLGVHLNIIEGKALSPVENSLLTDENGIYNNGFIKLLQKSFNQDFLNEVEKDFRQQIEKILTKTEVQFINSHVHTHAIPNLFNLTCKLADEYKIPYVRTQFEIPYLVPDLKKHLDTRYPINLIKLVLLNTFTLKNKQTIKKYNVKTNDYFGGVEYTSYMDVNAIKYCVKSVKNKTGVTEIILHPTLNQSKVDNFNEFNAVMDENLKQYLEGKTTDFKALLK